MKLKLTFIAFTYFAISTFAQSSSGTITEEINRELWKPLIESVLNIDYPLMASKYHPSAIMVFEKGQGNTKTATKYLENVKEGFKIKNKNPNTTPTYFKLRFSKRLDQSETAYETGIFMFDKVVNGVRKKNYTEFQFLLLKENGEWLVMMENQLERKTEEEWNALGKESEVE